MSMLKDMLFKAIKIGILLGLIYAVINGGKWFFIGYGLGVVVAYALLTIKHPMITHLKGMFNYDED